MKLEWLIIAPFVCCFRFIKLVNFITNFAIETITKSTIKKH